MSADQPAPLAVSNEKHGDDGLRPSNDSGTGLLRSPVGPQQDPRYAGPDGYIGRMQFERPVEDAPPRHPSRQMMRWGPPPSEWDDRDDRRGYARPSYDYGPRSAHPDYYPDDGYAPTRRMHSVREGPVRAESWRPPPRNRRRRMPQFEEASEYESDEEPKRRRRAKERDDSPPPSEAMRLPLTMWMNSSAKNHFVAFIGEFVGTTMFLLFAFAGTQVANIGAGNNSDNSTTGAATGFSPIVLMYIAISFGFSLMVNVWIFFRISGGLFNPAVTLAMVMVHSINFVRGFLLLVAQLVGSIFASFLVSVLFPTPFNVSTTLSASTSLVRGVFIEAILTAELVFTIFMMAKEKHKATFMAPVAIGLALFVAELVGVYYTGGSLNPARSFGPCVITGTFPQDHWIYWLGPSVGAVAAVAFYKFIKTLEYEMANPGQDAPSDDAAAASPKKPDVESA